MVNKIFLILSFFSGNYQVGVLSFHQGGLCYLAFLKIVGRFFVSLKTLCIYHDIGEVSPPITTVFTTFNTFHSLLFSFSLVSLLTQPRVDTSKLSIRESRSTGQGPNRKGKILAYCCPVLVLGIQDLEYLCAKEYAQT